MSTINQDGDFNEVICEFRFGLMLLLSFLVHNIWDVSAIARLSATDMYCDLDMFYKLLSAKELHCSAIVCVSFLRYESHQVVFNEGLCLSQPTLLCFCYRFAHRVYHWRPCSGLFCASLS